MCFWTGVACSHEPLLVAAMDLSLDIISIVTHRLSGVLWQLVLEQAEMTKKGREQAVRVKDRRAQQQQRKRERLKAAFIKKKVGSLFITGVKRCLLPC